MNAKNRRILSLFLPLLATAMFAMAGCESIDSKLDIPEGRDSDNNRYEDSDIIGPVLKLKLKDEAPRQEERPQDLLGTQTASDMDYRA